MRNADSKKAVMTLERIFSVSKCEKNLLKWDYYFLYNHRGELKEGVIKIPACSNEVDMVTCTT